MTAICVYETSLCSLLNLRGASINLNQFCSGRINAKDLNSTHLAKILDTMLMCSAQVNHAANKADQTLGILGSLVNRRSRLSISKGLLL
jgi:hypothetical protein